MRTTYLTPSDPTLEAFFHLCLSTMSKKKQQKNGFFYYMLDLQQELRQQGKSIPMRDMPIFAGPSWSKLSDAQKQMYNVRAKAEKAKGSGASGGIPAASSHPPPSNPTAPGRRDCSGTLISVRNMYIPSHSPKGNS